MLRDLLLENRSYRSYDASWTVTREELLDMVECTRMVASSVNRQPLKYRLVYEPAEVRTLAPYLQWAKGLPNVTLPPEGHEPPAYIVICHDTDIVPNVQAYYKDVGIAAQTILLAAVEMELGGCMIGAFNSGEVTDALSLTDNLVPVLVIAVGKPDEVVIITQANPGASVDYFRDDNNIHYVPKRTMEELIV